MSRRTVDQLLDSSHLPDALNSVIRQVISRSKLADEKKIEVTLELIGHFEDGLMRGKTVDQLVGSFGDPAVAGTLIRRLGRGTGPLDPARPQGSLGRWLAGSTADARLALRNLRRRPAFAALAIGILALGVGATGAVFSVVHGILIDPLPYPESNRLVNLWQTNPEWERSEVPLLRGFAQRFPASWPILQDWQELETVPAVGGFANGDLVLSGGAQAERVDVHYVTAGVFEALAVPPMLGRYFSRAEDVAGGPPVVVLSHELWRRQFAERPGLVGQTISLDGSPYTVIGVMPPGFAFPSNEGRLWLPFDDESRQRDRSSQFIEAIGRLAPGVELARVQTELDVIAAAQREETAEEYGARVAFLLDERVGSARPAILLLLFTVAVVMLIACVNLANLLLVRGAERRSEFAVRSALGANPATLRRQLVVEGLVLGVLGGVTGLALAAAVLDPLIQFVPDSIPRAENISLSWPVLSAAFAAGMVTSLVASLIPTIRSGKVELSQWIKEGNRASGTRERNRLRSVFVVTQVAAAFVLVAGAGVLLRSFTALINIDPGFDSGRLLVARVEAPTFRYPEADEMAAFHQTLNERLARSPGVTAVGSASDMPFVRGRSSRSVDIVTPEEVKDVMMMTHVIAGDLFGALEVPLLAGRTLDERDGPGSLRTMVVNETAQRELWPEVGAVGQRIRMFREEFTIVGVVGDVSPGNLTEEILPTLYISPWHGEGRGRQQDYALRGGSPEMLLAALRGAIRELDPMIPLGDVAMMDQLVANSVAEPRFRTVLVASLAALAAGLALAGIYGVVAYTVVQRTREIGIRMALGAVARSIQARVLVNVLIMVAVGLALGGVAVWLTFSSLEQFLYQVIPYDVTALAGAALAMVVVAIGAGWLPALRASRVDPMEVLRTD